MKRVWQLRSLLFLALAGILGCGVTLGFAAEGAPVDDGSLASAGAEWRAHMEAGKEAKARRDIAAAEKEFSLALDVGGREKPPGLASAVALNALAVLKIERKQWQEALPMLTDALSILENRKDTENEYYATILLTRSDLIRAQGHVADAERDCRRALAIKDLPKVVHDRALKMLVGVVCAQGRTEEASKLGAKLKLACRGGQVGQGQLNMSTDPSP